MTDEEVAAFAEIFQRFLESMSVARGGTSPLRELLDQHLGADSSSIPVVSNAFFSYDHVNVQVAIDAYLGGEDREGRLVGLTGQQRHHASLSDMLESAHMMGVRIGAPDLVNLPSGPDDSLDCVQIRPLPDPGPSRTP